jgi:ketosteroid isomerase-like protein
MANTEQVAAFLRELQSCWTGGALDRLNEFYHPDVVLLPPDLGPPIQGREAVVASYREFVDTCQLEEFDITAMETFSFPLAAGAVNMAHLYFSIAYRLGDERHLEKGLETYTIGEERGELQILWRSQIVLDSRLVQKSEDSS